MTRYFQQVRKLSWRNMSGTPCPPHGIIQVINYDRSHQMAIIRGRVSDGADTHHLINTNLAVQPNGIGSCTNQSPMMLATSATTLSYGDIIGPVSGSWQASTSGTGYKVVGDLSGGIVPVIQNSAILGPARRAQVTSSAADQDWTDITFLDAPGTARAFFSDLGMGEALEGFEEVTVVWSDVLPEDDTTEETSGWLIVTWPCEDSVSAIPPAPNNTGSDFGIDFSDDFGGPQDGDFNADFNYDFTLDTYVFPT